MQALKQQLAVEIDFWRDMIDNQPTPCPPESIERMRQALALAEHKLFLLHPEGVLLNQEAPQQDHSGTESESEFFSSRRH